MEIDADIRGKFEKIEEGYLYKDPSMICGRTGSIVYVEKGRIVIDADITGIDKVYYSISDDGLVKVSNNFADFDSKIDQDLMEFQNLKGYVPYPFTLKKGVKKTVPGLKVVLTQGGTKYEAGGDLHIFSRDKYDPHSFRDRLMQTLQENIQENVISSFSGGYDSLFLTKIHEERCKRILHFSEDRTVDVAYYKKVFPGIEWQIVGTQCEFSEKDVKLYFDSVDEPCCDPSGFVEFMMVRSIKDEKMPLMNGQSMDGIFANGRKYYQAHVASKLPGPLQRLGRTFQGSTSWIGTHCYDYSMDVKSRFYKFYTNNYTFRDEISEEMDSIYELYRKTIDNDEVNFMAALVMMLRYSIYEIEKMKTPVRAYGIRYYLPIVSTNVVDLAFDIPSNKKVGFSIGKKVLRDNFSEISRIKFISRDFVPNDLKERLIGEKMSEPKYKSFFIRKWMKYHDA